MGNDALTAISGLATASGLAAFLNHLTRVVASAACSADQLLLDLLTHLGGCGLGLLAGCTALCGHGLGLTWDARRTWR